MIGVVLNAIEQCFIGLLADDRECQDRWISVTKPDRTSENSPPAGSDHQRLYPIEVL